MVVCFTFFPLYSGFTKQPERRILSDDFMNQQVSITEVILAAAQSMKFDGKSTQTHINQLFHIWNALSEYLSDKKTGFTHVIGILFLEEKHGISMSFTGFLLLFLDHQLVLSGAPTFSYACLSDDVLRCTAFCNVTPKASHISTCCTTNGVINAFVSTAG